MRLSDIGEFGFIERIQAILDAPDDRVLKGIGDDCAVMRLEDDTAQVVTTDALIEGVHFRQSNTDGERLGHKSLAVSLSDVAAMGARPTIAVVTVAAPSDTSVDYLEAIYRGMQRLADRTGTHIVGGDTTRSTTDLMISVTLIGTAPIGRIRYREDARPGDALLLAGVVGDSGAGLHLLEHSVALPNDISDVLRNRHLAPEPLLVEGTWLARSGIVGAMMDVSDGIASDVGHLCTQSAKKSGNAVGVRIRSTDLPITESLAHFVEATASDPLDYLLRSGEDYALLLTVPETKAESIMAGFRDTFDTPINHIGEITGSSSRLLIDETGLTQNLSGGHDHYLA